MAEQSKAAGAKATPLRHNILHVFFSFPLRLPHSIPHLFKQLITLGNFPDVLGEKRLTSCRLKQLSKVQKSVTIYQLEGSTHFCV